MLAAERIAFERPDGQVMDLGGARPVDLAHLARQTGGDRGLESDILCLFRQQLTLGLTQLRKTRGRERMLIAHTLKGSSRSVGAFSLSRMAEQIEECPGDDVLIDALAAEAARVADYIQSVCR